MAVFNESFTDANGTLLQNHAGYTYSDNTGYVIQNNRLYCDYTNGDKTEIVGVTTGDTYTITLDFHKMTDAGNLGVVFCANAVGDSGYLIRVNVGQQIKLWEINSGNYNTTANETHVFSVADGADLSQIDVIVSATDIDVHYGGASVFTYTDSTHARAGNLFLRSSQAGSTTTGYHLDTLNVTNATVPSVRSISSINEGEDIPAGQSVNITGAAFDLPIASVTLGGEALTVTGTPTTTNIDVDVPLHVNCEWGGSTNQLVVTDNTGALTLDSVPLVAPVGWETVVYSGTIPNAGTTESYYEEAITDLGFTMVAGDTLAWSSSPTLTVGQDTMPTINPPITATGSYKIWDDSLSTWTAASTYAWTDGGTPSITIDSITPSTIYPATQLTINHSNATLSGKTVTVDGQSASIDSQDADTTVLNAIDPLTFGDDTLEFNTNLTIEITNGGA